MGNNQSTTDLASRRADWDKANNNFIAEDGTKFKVTEVKIEELEEPLVVVKRNSSHANLKCFKERKILVPLQLIENLEKQLTADQAVVLLENARFHFSKFWQNVARQLDVPSEKRNKCRRQLAMDPDCDYIYLMEDCLDHWITNSYEASWSRLIEVVAFYEPKTSEELRKQLGLYTSDIHAKLKKECEEDFLDVLSKKLTQPKHFQALVPYLLCEAGEQLVDEESDDSDDVSLKMLKMLQHWKDCWNEKATFEALVCVVKKAFPSEPDIAEFIVSFVSGDYKAHLPSPIVQEIPKFYKEMTEEEKVQHKAAYRKLTVRFSLLVSTGAAQLCHSTNTQSFIKINCFILNQLGRQAATMQPTARSIEELMEFISQRVSWFNFEIFENLVMTFGDEEVKRELAAYKVALKQYLNQSILCLPQTDCSRLQSTNRCLVVYLKIPDHESQIPNVYGLDVPEIKERLREHMGISDQAQIEFKTHRQGCIELVFAITGYSARCIEWDEERQEYRITGSIFKVLPSSFCRRNKALSVSLKQQLTITSDEESKELVKSCNKQFENSGNALDGFSFSISGAEH